MNEAKQVFEGIARNAKSGAVLVTDAGGAIYIEGLSEWPGPVDGRRVRASGVLVAKKFIPDPINERGEIQQGAWGSQEVLRHATWEVVGG